ncbi:hypothetical protein [Pedobacter frigiditerrae]|uniref:hypothetical protein n=1 Tax=Pedobacter frigiditerrae TaxID=2530452 RepID=UPI00292EBA17|nr:hypothetical protein [Pedobacter frigiditerrae]
MKYLQFEQLKNNLNIGKPVEQWIGHAIEKDYVVLKWIRIEKENDEFYGVVYTECFDEGDGDFLDIYEFSTIDPDESFGIINTFSTVDKAIEFALNEYGASINKFVNSGMIQDEYLLYLKNR